MIYATCLSLLLAAAALAADIKIEGETKVEGNKLVRLNVAAPEKSGVIWDVWPEGKADVEEIPGGKLIFTGPSGEYTVKARVITSVDGGIKIDTGRATVTIGTPAPPIPPGPGPDPGPDPIPPPNLKGLAKITYDAAVKLNDSATARKYAANFASASSAIAAGAYNGKPFDQARQAIFADLAAANRTVTQSAPAWQSFGTVIVAELNTRQKSGQLNSLQAIGAAFDEIRTGLEAVR